MRKVIYSPETIYKIPNVFGDGSDGNVTISGNTTLTQDMFYENLTVNSGVTLNTGGYRIYVRTRLTNNGTIARNGNNQSGGSGGAGLSSGTLVGSVAGGNGGTFGSAGAVGKDIKNSKGGSGGAGGNGGVGAGGAAGSATAPLAGFGSARNFFEALQGKGAGEFPYTPQLSLGRSAFQSIPTSTDTKIQWNNEEYDNDAMFDDAVDNDDVYIVTPGIYTVHAIVKFSGNATGYRQLSLPLSLFGSTMHDVVQYVPNVNALSLDASFSIFLDINQTMYVQVWQNSGGALNIGDPAVTGSDTRLNMVLTGHRSLGFSGGAGGGGGGSGGGFGFAPGGGGGAGLVLVAANILDNTSGSIQTKGGSSSNATGNNDGGGGGGGGGCIFLVYNKAIVGTTNVLGGTGGAGNGTGSAGANGLGGNVIEVKAV